MSKPVGMHIEGRYAIEGQRIFDSVSLSLPAGQWTCVLGRSGVGKTTLLRLIAGLDCHGDFVGHITASDDVSLAGRGSFMAQTDLLLPWLSVLENTVLGARLRGEAPDLARAETLLERVGLGTHMSQKPSVLSGGMRQRNALARTLMEDRPVVFLDEPFSALDASTRADMQDLTADLLQGKTVMLVTHDPSEAVRLGHKVVILEPNGAQNWPVPDTPPVRDLTEPDAVRCQANLLNHLRGLV